MNDQDHIISETGAGTGVAGLSAGPPTGLGWLVLLSVWCGLTAGLLELLTVVIRKRFFDENRLYQMSHHFIWILPAANTVLFLLAGLLGCAVIMVAPGAGIGSCGAACARWHCYRPHWRLSRRFMRSR